jgi:hypothetical protein
MQCSSFGAFLDVFVDNLTRGTLWVWSTPAPFGVLPVILETTVFTCTHRVRPTIDSSGRDAYLCNHFSSKSCCDVMPGGWSSLEDRLFQSSSQVWSTDNHAQHMLCQMLPSSPSVHSSHDHRQCSDARWVQSIMADGFKTFSGALAIVGLMGLPLWLWACRY